MQNFQGIIRKEMEFPGIRSLLGNFQGVFFVEFLGLDLPFCIISNIKKSQLGNCRGFIINCSFSITTPSN